MKNELQTTWTMKWELGLYKAYQMRDATHILRDLTVLKCKCLKVQGTQGNAGNQLISAVVLIF